MKGFINADLTRMGWAEDFKKAERKAYFNSITVNVAELWAEETAVEEVVVVEAPVNNVVKVDIVHEAIKRELRKIHTKLVGNKNDEEIIRLWAQKRRLVRELDAYLTSKRIG